MASELVVTRSARTRSASTRSASTRPAQQRAPDRILDVAALEAASPDLEAPGIEAPGIEVPGIEVPGIEAPDLDCVVCGAATPEPLACCSSRCAGEAQRQVHRNAARLHRLHLRDAPDQRRRLAERNGRLMSAILRWRPESHGPCPDAFID